MPDNAPRTLSPHLSARFDADQSNSGLRTTKSKCGVSTRSLMRSLRVSVHGMMGSLPEDWQVRHLKITSRSTEIVLDSEVFP